MAAIQRSCELRHYTPHKVLLGIFVCLDKVFDYCSQVSSTTVLHVQIKVLGRLEMFAMIVGHDVGVSQGTQDIKFGGELFALFVGHLYIVYLFATKDLIRGINVSYPTNNQGTKGIDLHSRLISV